MENMEQGHDTDHSMMGHDHMHHGHGHESKLKTYKPVIIAFAVVIAWTIVRFFTTGGTIETAMSDFMGGFFMVFGLLKVLGYKGFVETFPRYDLLASRSKLYTYTYPFIELALGALFIWNTYSVLANVVTFAIMTMGSVGVYRTLKKGTFIQCACLGGLFSIPISYVTLFEDLLMAAMSGIMLALMIAP